MFENLQLSASLSLLYCLLAGGLLLSQSLLAIYFYLFVRIAELFAFYSDLTLNFLVFSLLLDLIFSPYFHVLCPWSSGYILGRSNSLIERVLLMVQKSRKLIKISANKHMYTERNAHCEWPDFLERMDYIFQISHVRMMKEACLNYTSIWYYMQDLVVVSVANNDLITISIFQMKKFKKNSSLCILSFDLKI